MKKWGLLITLYYVLAVLLLLTPMFVLLCEPSSRTLKGYFGLIFGFYADRLALIPVAVAVGGQILLLVLSVDTSFRRNKPRAHIFLSITLAGSGSRVEGLSHERSSPTSGIRHSDRPAMRL